MIADRKIAKPKSLTALALEKIRDGITSGHYPLGAPLYEKVLAEEFGISKTPVREALVQLQHDGLVVVVPHSGTFVFDLADGEVSELCELRLILETNALQLAMQRQPGRMTSDSDKIVESMRQAIVAGRIDEYRSLDNQFHWAFFAHCGNAYLATSYAMIEAKITTLRMRLITPLPELITASMEEHALIASALADADTSRAIAILTAHVRRARDLMQRLNEVAPIDITRIGG